VQGVVYLMGVAQNQAELNRVIETARTISGVKQVVSYVKLAGEPLAGEEKAEPLPTTDVSAQPQSLQPHMGQTQNTVLQPVQNYKPVANSNVVNEIEPDIDVPAVSVPSNAPSIEDQYYN